ncbi:MAG TPA: helix-turn-helix domain-containing protein [Kiloniellales bacterium]|jgi:hypothetical protein
MNNPELLTARQAAEFLGVSTEYLELHRRLGDGPEFLKLTDAPNGIVRYRRDALEKWLAERTRTQTGESA